jgi:hypothetical protein
VSDIVIPSKAEFEAQAKLHDLMRDSLQMIVNSFEPQQNRIVDHLDKDQVEYYKRWWQNTRGELLKQASIHDQLGQHLRTAKETYYSLEQHIVMSMTTKP